MLYKFKMAKTNNKPQILPTITEKENPTHNNAEKFSWYISFSFIVTH